MSEVDTGAVVEAAVAELHDADAGAETTVDNSAETPETGAAAGHEPDTKAETEPNDEAEIAAVEKEWLAKNPGAKGRIQTSRHQAILTRTRNRYEAQLAELNKRAEGFKRYEDPEFQNRLKAFEISETDHNRFVEILLGVPQYKQLFDSRVAEAVKAATAAPPKVEEPPKPDVLREDGTLGYSAEAAEKLAQFYAKKEREAAEKQYEERFSKLDKDLQPVREREEAIAKLNDSIDRSRSRLERSRERLPGFKENESKILEYMMQPGNERVDLDEAYANVLFKTRDQVRAEEHANIAKQLSEKSKATRTVRPGMPEATAEPDDSSEANDTESIIRRSIAGLR